MKILEKYLGVPLLETERLVLRKFRLNDYNDVYSWASMEETCTYLVWNPHQSADESKEAVHRWISYYEKSGYYWAIEHKDEGQVIGSVFVHRAIPKDDLMEVGIFISPRYWKRGYGKESLLAAMNFLFTQARVGTIMAKHDCANIASQSLLLSCGMERNLNYNGKRERRNGTLCELFYYTSFAEQWLEWYSHNFKKRFVTV